MHHYFTHFMHKIMVKSQSQLLKLKWLKTKLLGLTLLTSLLLAPLLFSASVAQNMPLPERPTWSWVNPEGETGTGYASKSQAVAAMKASCTVCRELVNERLSAVNEDLITFEYFGQKQEPIPTDVWVYPRMDFALLTFVPDLGVTFSSGEEQEAKAEAEFFDPVESSLCGDNFLSPASPWSTVPLRQGVLDESLRDAPIELFAGFFSVPEGSKLVAAQWQRQLKQGSLSWEAPQGECLGGPGQFFGDYAFSRVSGLLCREPYSEILEGQCVIPETAKVFGPLDVECETESNPCSPATGAKLETADDITTGTLTFIRHYNSQKGLADAGFGENWSHNFHKRMSGGLENTNDVSFVAGDGRHMSFTFSQAQTDALAQDVPVYVANDYPSYGVVPQRSLSGGIVGVNYGYTLRLPDGTSERYDRFGRLSEINNNGAITQLSYDVNGHLSLIKNDVGHSLQFTVDVNDRITTITTDSGAEYHYEYDLYANISRITYPAENIGAPTKSRNYHYENTGYPNHLTGITDENGDRYGVYRYDVAGRVLSSEHAQTTNGVPQHRYTFDYRDGETLVTDPAGTEVLWSFERQSRGFNPVVGKIFVSDQKNRDQRYDANNNLIEYTDEEGLRRHFEYSAAEQMIKQIIAPDTAQQREISYEYLPPATQLRTRIIEPSVLLGQQKITNINYDDDFNISGLSVNGFTPQGTPVTRTIQLEYNARGKVTQFDGPRTDINDISSFEYYDCVTGAECGQLKRAINPLGHVTSYDRYDAQARLTQMTDANGIVTDLAYHPRGWLLQITQSPPSEAARTTQFAYDGLGQITQVQLPDGVTLQFGYDAAHELRTVTDNLGNRVEYRYDTRGNRTQYKLEDDSGVLTRQIELQYNIRNHIERINDAGSIHAIVQNARGDLVGYTDANQNPSAAQQYDVLGRVTTTVDALSNATHYTYSVADQLTQVTATNGSVTDYVYDDLGNLLSEASADRGLMTYIHDTAGNVVTQTDARGVTVHYQYDALNRLTDVSFPNSSEDIRYGYDSCPILGVGRLCTLDHEAGSEALAYDSWGNVIMQVREERGQDLAQTITATTRYAYDAANRVMQITYPSGRVVDYSRDAIGRLIAATSIASDGEVTDLFSNRQYRADGLWMAQDYGTPNNGSSNALSQTKQYDQQGRLLAHLAGDYNRQYQYDANGNIVDITGSLNSLYRYDPLDRLVENTASDLGINSGFSYDANGNRTIATKSGGNSLFLDYANNSNRLTQVSGNPVTLDSSGRTISDANGRYYHYNDAGRLAALRQGGATGAVIAQYHYNSNQLRTRKTVGADTTLYHYDLAGNMLAESDEIGEFTHEYVYADGERIAVFASAVSNGAELNLSNHVAFHAQDQASSGEVVADSSQIALNGNRWRATPVNYTITPNTILEFDFSSTQQGEIHGIGLDSDLSLNPHRLFHLYGTQAYGNRTYSTYSGSGVEHFFIPIGQYYQGDASYLFFAMDDDVNQAGNSVFSNVRLYENSEQTLQTEQRVNLSDVQSYGGSQDGQGVVDVIDDGGQALRLHGNRWQRIAMPVVITPTMRLEFDFKSSVQGEVQGIGVDTNNGISANQTFQLYGSQTWGIQSYRNYGGQGDYQSYSLPIGEHVTGLYDYITFTMDDDASAQGESVFRNVRFVDQAVDDNEPAQTATYFYINDHLGTPQRLLDQDGDVSWEASYEAFGLATINTAEVEQNHRFLGQYYDQESGLHYNWHRYYDPTLGRYITSDPIGLLGGGNTFGYVGGNPLRYSDPYGLCVGPLIVPCGYFVANAPAINTFFIVTAELLAGVGIASTAGKVVHGVAKSSVNAAKQCFIKGVDDVVGEGVRIVDQVGDAVEIVAKGAQGDITVIANMSRNGDQLLLNRAHIDGLGAGSSGISELRNLARQLGQQQGVKEVVIQGGRRTTGARPGKVPRPVTVKVE